MLIFCIPLCVRVIRTDPHSVPLSWSTSSSRRKLCFSKVPPKKVILVSVILGQGRQSRHQEAPGSLNSCPTHRWQLAPILSPGLKSGWSCCPGSSSPVIRREFPAPVSRLCSGDALLEDWSYSRENHSCGRQRRSQEPGKHVEQGRAGIGCQGSAGEEFLHPSCFYWAVEMQSWRLLGDDGDASLKSFMARCFQDVSELLCLRPFLALLNQELKSLAWKGKICICSPHINYCS